jgi:hypothetical protein
VSIFFRLAIPDKAPRGHRKMVLAGPRSLAQIPADVLLHIACFAASPSLAFASVDFYALLEGLYLAIDVPTNHLPEVLAAVASHLPRIRSLRLKVTPEAGRARNWGLLTIIGPLATAGCLEALTLDLRGHGLSSSLASLAMLPAFPVLRDLTLDLGGNGLARDDVGNLELLANCCQLAYLDLRFRSNRLGDADLYVTAKAVIKLPRLRSLTVDISDNGGVRVAAVRFLERLMRSERPGCHVVFSLR